MLTPAQIDVLLQNSPWPEKLYPTLKKLIFLESSNQPGNKNAESSATGLIQIMYSAHKDSLQTAGIITSQADLYNPIKNLKAAYYVFTEA